MIVPALIVLLAIAALIQPTANRRWAALVYVAPITLYPFWSDMLSDQAYYLLAMTLSGVSAEIIGRLDGADNLRRNITILCGCSVAANLFGWATYSAGASPASYNGLFMVLYIAAIFVLMKGCGYARDSGSDSYTAGVYRHAYTGIQHREARK